MRCGGVCSMCDCVSDELRGFSLDATQTVDRMALEMICHRSHNVSRWGRVNTNVFV